MKWLSEHSTVLNVIANIVIAITGMAIAYEQPSIKGFFQRADVRVESSVLKSTMPPQFLISVNNILTTELPKVLQSTEALANQKQRNIMKSTGSDESIDLIRTLEESTKRIQDKLRLPAIDRLRNTFSNEYETWTIRVRNQTDHSISMIRVNFGNTYWIWDTEVAGTFLTPDEKEGLERNIRSVKYRRDTFELTTLPARADVTIYIYGSFSVPSVSISAQNAKVHTENVPEGMQATGNTPWMFWASILLAVLVIKDFMGFLLTSTPIAARESDTPKEIAKTHTP
jgi:hypothetical protein